MVRQTLHSSSPEIVYAYIDFFGKVFLGSRWETVGKKAEQTRLWHLGFEIREFVVEREGYE